MQPDNRLYQYFAKKWLRKYLPSATLPAHTLDCPECGSRIALPKLRQGQKAICSVCGHHLVHIEPEPYVTVLACALAALILMVVVYSLPFVNVEMTGMFSPLTLSGMFHALLVDSWGFLAAVLLTFVFGLPLLFLLLAIYVYAYFLFKQEFSPTLRNSMRLLLRVQQWMMVDVFFISMLVAYIKIQSVAAVNFGVAFWLMPFLVILILRTSVAISPHWLYSKIQHADQIPFFQAGEETVCCSRCLHFRPKNEVFCRVCDSELFHRRPGSLKMSFLLLLAAMILYVPANLLPIMISENPLNKEISTIMSGIIFMWNDGDKLIASIIFSASIAVPTLKILSMLWLLFSARFKPLLSIKALSLQYRITEAIGRWSMIDIFVIIIMMTTFHSKVARVTPGPAAIYFCLVVVLTMLSAHFFDVRLLWDKTVHKFVETD